MANDFETMPSGTRKALDKKDRKILLLEAKLNALQETLASIEEDHHFFYTCPICYAENTDYESCGCYNEVHYGRD